jgi:DNA-binding beta-propeller fold protein YncE
MFRNRMIPFLTLTLLILVIGAARPDTPSGGKIDYRVVPSWARIPADVTLGPVSAVATDAADRVFVCHRAKRPVLVFARDGTFLRSWGDEHLKTPHGLRIDSSGNVWLTDIGHHQVLKFNADGKLLMALGKQGQAGQGEDQFARPTDVAFTPSGDFYVSDGYDNTRVLKFSKDGKLLEQWGKPGTGPGEFNLPHSICLDPKGRVIVGDRENNRIQVFDADGKFVTQWTAGGAPFGMFLAGDRLFVADGRSHWVTVLDTNGKSLGRFGEAGTAPGQFKLPHMLCVDSKGAVYVAEVENKRIQKFEPRRD